MSVNQFNQVSYGFTQSLIAEFPLPIVSVRAPGANDKAQLGTEWIDKTTNMVYILTSIVNNAATWVTAGGAGGAGVFASLEATIGNITADLGNIVATVGNITATAGNIVATAGNITASAGAIRATLGDVTAGNDIVAFNDVVATNGNVSSTLGNIVADAGNISATLGNITAAAGNIVATAGHFLVNGLSIVTGAGDPNGIVNAAQGSLYLNTAGTGVNDRAWINTDGITTWTFITTGA